jgi:hypothetical protein
MKRKQPVFYMAIFVMLFLLAACSGLPERVESTAAPTRAVSAAATLKPAAVPDQTPTDLPSPSPLDALGVYPENAEAVIADGFFYLELTDEIKDKITGMSYPADDRGAKVTYDDLRYIRLKYYDFEGHVHEDGELIVNRALAQEVTEIFFKLYEAEYPFTSIRLVDEYGEAADDNLSMAANNTSAFNYRFVTGTDTLSLHSYGYAIDVNPRLNPYISDGRVAPENGAAYADRSLGLPGMIDPDDLCYRLFTEYGWRWGGDWEGDKDYQHFSKDLRP